VENFSVVSGLLLGETGHMSYSQLLVVPETLPMSDAQPNRNGLSREPFWYKSGVIYELHVRAFCDSDDNGIGDFKGLTSKLDYLKDLGITALWLLPFYPSPLKDDGYDTADYFEVHPMYGTLADFKLFLREAHKRGLRVITELVLNHTSDQHPWFQRARRAKPGSRWRDFYVWSDNTEKYKEARVIFKDIEVSNWSWDHAAGAYYWHRFFSHQPDLNWDNPEVYDEMVKVIDFWFDLGVDGLRLDAVPYLYEREGTSCENLPETHATLKRLRQHVDAKYTDRMLLGEANQWPEDAVAYFGQGKGDECHMAFHFPLMPRLFMALRMEDRTPIVDILEQTPPIPETSQWALFLRNHDELTLEMVTDEERDYMYRMYAHVNRARLNLGIRRRLAPLLGNDRRRIELLNTLLLSLPGTPVLYYGDEIGMGENIYLGDRNGVRTPMQWSSDKNAGFSRANPQALYLPIIYDPEYHYEAVNVEAQLQNPHSLLWWMRRLLALRKRWRALGEGTCEFLHPENHKILSYLLRFEGETILVVVNLSRFVQPVELDLNGFNGYTPVELFGRMEFPSVASGPYFLTLSPHAFYLFALELKAVATATAGALGVGEPPRAIAVRGDWTAALADGARVQLESRLPDWLRHQHWFAGRAKKIKQAAIRETIPVPGDKGSFHVALIQVDYVQSETELYQVPLSHATDAAAGEIRTRQGNTILAELTGEGGAAGVLYDAGTDAQFGRAYLDLIAGRRVLKNEAGELTACRTTAFRQILGKDTLPPATPSKYVQHNTSVMFGDRAVLKLFRQLHPGKNPDQEIGAFLTEHGFAHAQRMAGALELATATGEQFTLAIVGGFVPNVRNAWDYMEEVLSRYYDRASSTMAEGHALPEFDFTIQNLMSLEIPDPVETLVGTVLDSVHLLGRRTAELHLALSVEKDDPRFAPEPFTPHYVRGLFQSMRNVATQNLKALRKQLRALPPEISTLARRVVDLEPEIMKRYRALHERRVSGRRIRCHGDLHLGQVLYTGKDFVFLDFEGDPNLPISERSIKRSALRDVASMVRSFHYAAWTGLHQHVQRGCLEADCLPRFEPWARLWYRAAALAYLRAYLEHMKGAQALPQPLEELQILLPAYLLNRAMIEVGHELQNRPEWLHVPLQGVLNLIEITRAQSPA
jgi:maltose alpha-D-glucosyltransferase/alpha-amylase